MTGSSSKSAPGHGPKPTTLPKEFHPSRASRVGNKVMGRLIRWGLVPHSYLLTVPGRKTGEARTLPVTLVEHDDGKRWLVAPYGVMNWVRNVRAAGRILLVRRGFRQSFDVREVSGADAAAVLKDYLKIANAVRGYFYADKNSPVEVFVKEAHLHPVFELTAVDGAAGS